MNLDPVGPQKRLPSAEHRAPPHPVELTSDGRLKAARATRYALRSRLKSAEMLETAPEWVLLRNLNPEEAEDSEATETVVIAAGIVEPRALSLIDLIGFLESGHNTGTLVVIGQKEERAISFRQGNVVLAESSVQDEQPDRVVARLLDQGIEAKTDAEQHALYDYVRDILDGILSLTRGMWSFARVPDNRLPDRVIAKTQGLLMDALRRQDEMQVYRQRIRSLDVRIRRVATPASAQASMPSDPNIAAIAEMILPRLEIPCSIYELMMQLGQTEFEVTRSVYHLLRTNRVSIVSEEEDEGWATAPPLSAAEAREIIQVYVLGIREVFEEIRRRGGELELRNSVEDYLAIEAGSGAFARILQNIVIDDDGEMDTQTLLFALSQHPISAKELNEALGELLFFVLFQATEALGRQRGDALARRVKMIHGMLAKPGPELAP